MRKKYLSAVTLKAMRSTRLCVGRKGNELIFSFNFYFADPSLTQINPYIRHWEAARYDRTPLDDAHRYHHSRHRRKRDVNITSEYAVRPNSVKFSFYAHDRYVHCRHTMNIFLNLDAGLAIKCSFGSCYLTSSC